MKDKEPMVKGDGGLYVPQIDECIIYHVASNPAPQVGYCTGYVVWDELLQPGVDRIGGNGCRFHVRIANDKGGKPINMRGIHDIRKATLSEELRELIRPLEGCADYEGAIINLLIDKGIVK